MNLDALKRAVNTVRVPRVMERIESMERLRKAVRISKRASQDDKDHRRLSKQLDAEREALLALIIENIQLKAKLECPMKETDRLVVEMYAELMRLKKHRQQAAKRSPRRPTDDEGLIDWYEVNRAIHKLHTRKINPLKQIAAATEVKAAWLEKEIEITISPESMAKNYRKWKAKRMA